MGLDFAWVLMRLAVVLRAEAGFERDWPNGSEGDCPIKSEGDCPNGSEGDWPNGSEGDCPNESGLSKPCLLSVRGSVTPTAVAAGLPFLATSADRTGMLHAAALTGRVPANVHESASDRGAHLSEA